MELKPYLYSKTIRSLIERSFILASLFILVVTMVSVLYFNQRSLQEKRESNLQKIHQILANLIMPELAISNTSEIRRLLQLASTPDEVFIVVDENGIALMPDYSKIVSLKSVLNSKDGQNCNFVKTFYRNIDGSGYWVTCSPLVRDNEIIFGSKNYGVLFTFSKYKGLLFSPMMIYPIGISMLTILIVIIWFRQILYRRLLQPIIILCSRIVDMTKAPLTTNTAIGEIGSATEEIISIKQAFEALLLNLQTEYRQRTESEKKAVLLDLAIQVTHDIRSPLAVMEMTLLSYAKYIPEEDANIQREAIQSVRNISDNILNRYREPIYFSKNQELSYLREEEFLSRPIFLYLLVESIISHKKQEWKNRSCQINFTFDPTDKFVCVNAVPNDVKRVLSNILNNAYESLEHERHINLKIEIVKDYVKLHITDTGIGIAKENINAVLNGKSLKHSGKGLGLSNAKSIIENMGGSLELFSVLGSGTQVVISFCLVSKPTWFPNVIKLSSHFPTVVLDDDSSIHNLWRQRLHANNKKHVQHFLNSQDLLHWYNNNLKISHHAVFLVDYELRNDTFTGLELLKKFNLKDRGYLITGHAEEIHIQQQVVDLGAWLIPKLLISDFPLLF